MGKYGRTAVLATSLITERKLHPTEAWRTAAAQIFPDSPSSQKKGYPKTAFLGLCEDGLLLGVPSGSYTKSRDNKRYAIEAIKCLRQNPSLVDNEKSLWKLIIGSETKVENSQIDVVTSLWREGLITK